MEHYNLDRKRILAAKILAVLLLALLINFIIRSMLVLNWKFLLFLLGINAIVAMHYGRNVIFLLLAEIPLLSQIPKYGIADLHNYSSLSIELALTTISCGFLAQFVFKKDAKLRKTRVDIAILAFILIAAISLSITAINAGLGLYGWLHTLANFHVIFLTGQLDAYYPFRALWTIFEGFLLYYLCVNLFDKKFLIESKKKIIISLLVAVFILAFGAAVQHYSPNSYSYNLSAYHGSERINSFMNNANTLGAWIIGFAFLLFFFSRESLGKLKYMGYAGCFAMLVLLFLTFSQGAWMGFAFGMAFLLFVANWNYIEGKFGKMRILFASFITLALAIILLFSFAVQYDESRARIWGAGINAFEDNIIFGMGIGTFYADSVKYYPEDVQKWMIANGSHYDAHNYFLQIAAELGILGLIAFISIFWILLLNGVSEYGKGKGRLLLGCLCGIAALLGHSLVDHHLLIPEIWLGLWILAALVAIDSEKSEMFI